MKVHALSVLALTATLAACGSKTETNEAAATNTAAPAATETNAMAGDMGNMAMSPTAKMAKGTGKVTAVDKAAGTITLLGRGQLAGYDDGIQGRAGAHRQRESGR